MLLSAGIAVIEVISVQTLIFVPGSCVPCRKYLNHFIILPLVLPTTIVFTIDFKYYYSLCFSVNFITHLISLSGMNVIAWYCLGTYWVNLFRYLLFLLTTGFATLFSTVSLFSSSAGVKLAVERLNIRNLRGKHAMFVSVDLLFYCSKLFVGFFKDLDYFKIVVFVIV